MQFSIIAAIIPLLSLASAQGFWNCLSTKVAREQGMVGFDGNYPNGACQFSGGGSVPAPCNAARPCRVNGNGCTPSNNGRNADCS